MEDTSLKRRVPQDTHARPGSIRMYSQSAPPWFSTADMDALRFLSGSAVAGVSDISLPGHPPLLLFQGTAFVSGTPPGDTHRETGGEAPVCHGRCGLIKRPVDLTIQNIIHFTTSSLHRQVHCPGQVCSGVFVPTDSRACAVLLWDPSLAPAVRLTWGSYQRALGHQAEWGCPTIHHSEWSKLALFDFLLQVYDRLDRNCCGFKPRREDLCVEKGLHRECADQDSVDLVHIVHRQGDPGRLVFIDNKGYFDRDESNLDFKLLEGIKELPESAIAVLRSRRLREKLLQSLFLDEAYWESQGGRQGIEKLIDVVERRAKVLLTYINAHGIKLAPMGN
ncbi:F198B protein, partial [Amia calva]|nr:F198B protein [Amia calva]